MADSDGKPKENLSMAAASTISSGIGGICWGIFYRQLVANNTTTLLGVPLGEPDSGTKWSMFIWSGICGVTIGSLVYAALQFIYGLTKR